MTTHDDSGPAFPTTPVSHGFHPMTGGEGTGASPGMTLRQWYAGLAMQGELAFSQEGAQSWSDDLFPVLVKRCYKLADLMIAGPQPDPVSADRPN